MSGLSSLLKNHSVQTSSASSRQSTAQTIVQSSDFLNCLKSTAWHDIPCELRTARTLYGAAVVQRKCEDEAIPMKEVIVVAGGIDDNNNTLSTVEVFDPSNNTTTPWHELKRPRYGCGAFAVGDNAMIVLGGMLSDGRENSYRKTVEIVTDRETKLLPDEFSLPHQMAFFGTATISGKVYIFGGQTEGKESTLGTMYTAELSFFEDATRGRYPKRCVWSPVESKSRFENRQNFATVVINNECWFIGGVNRTREKDTSYTIVHSVGKCRYEPKKTTYTYYGGLLHRKGLPRYGCTGFALGEYVVVLGGRLPTNSPERASWAYSSSSGSTDNSSLTGIQKKASAFLFCTNSTRPQPIFWDSQEIRMQDQGVFKIRGKFYAIGQYDFIGEKPTSVIKCLNLDFPRHEQNTSGSTTHLPFQMQPQIRSNELNRPRYGTRKEEKVVSERYVAPEQWLNGSNCNQPNSIVHDDDSSKIKHVMDGTVDRPAIVSKEYLTYCNVSQKTKIGKGGFGVVLKGTDKSLGLDFAFKTISVDCDTENALAAFKKERQLLTRLRHPNIVRLYGYHLDQRHSFLVYEYLNGGDLADYYSNEEKRATFTFDQRLRVMENVLCALSFLHSKSPATYGKELFHRDIKPQNICLTRFMEAKLIDYGLARFELSESHDYVSRYSGTPQYVCKTYNGQYTSECDIYSFGIVMIELITGTLNGMYRNDFYSMYLPVQTSNLTTSYDIMIDWPNVADRESLCDLALRCIQNDYKKRPKATELFFEIHNMYLRSRIGLDWRRECMDCTTDPCVRCNQCRKYIACKNGHITCILCISSLAIAAVDKGRDVVPCKKCGYEFERHELYSKIDQRAYDGLHCKGVFGNAMKVLKEIHDRQNEMVRDMKNIQHGVNVGLQALANLTAQIHDNKFPKLVWIVPQESNADLLRHPVEWLKNVKKFHLYFICEYSFTAVKEPVVLDKPQYARFIKRLAPILKLSIIFLKVAKTFASLPLPIPNIEGIKDCLEKISDFVDSIMDTSSGLADIAQLGSDFANNNLNESDSSRLKLLTEEAYTALSKEFCNEWIKGLRPLLIDGGSTIWIKHEYYLKASALYRCAPTNPSE